MGGCKGHFFSPCLSSPETNCREHAHHCVWRVDRPRSLECVLAPRLEYFCLTVLFAAVDVAHQISDKLPSGETLEDFIPGAQGVRQYDTSRADKILGLTYISATQTAEDTLKLFMSGGWL